MGDTERVKECGMVDGAVVVVVGGVEIGVGTSGVMVIEYSQPLKPHRRTAPSTPNCVKEGSIDN